MINLLPPSIKDDYGYSRRNVHLLHWVFIFAFAVVGFVYMQQLSNNYQQQIEAKQMSLRSQHLAETKKTAKEMSDNLKLAVQVLGQEVLFSDLLKQLAAVTPANAKLTSLTISQTTGALDIIAKTTNSSAASQLQVNYTDPANKIFSKADIVNINCSSGSSTGADTKYPCNVTIRVLFADDNPFLFVNAEKRN
jgi:archaellum component FlaF (FlaF/FlaG flagellin family)